jgi:sulfite reductase alpha subunit-like flavoprotein
MRRHSLSSFTMATHTHQPIPTTATSHPDNPIPTEPVSIPPGRISPSSKRSVHSQSQSQSPRSSGDSLGESTAWSEATFESEVSTPSTELHDQFEDMTPTDKKSPIQSDAPKRRASTHLITSTADDIRKLLGTGESGTQFLQKYCCGGGCCQLKTLPPDTARPGFIPVVIPDNDAYRALGLKVNALTLDTGLSDIVDLPKQNFTLQAVPKQQATTHHTTVDVHPPTFVQPHPPYDVYSAPVFHARQLTNEGAEKRTVHFDIDITDYPKEGDVDFKVGGAVGICPPNEASTVDEILTRIGCPKFLRDKAVTLKTNGGRWPTIWGDEMPRELLTTRRELLTWCVDIASSPPTKQLFRVLAEYADAKNERKILEYMSSAQGQGAFCDLRTGPNITLLHLLEAFPSSRPPFELLLSCLNQLMPRFYSLSNDPHVSSDREGLAGRRIIEIAVTIHETPHWTGKMRTGVGSGYLERVARHFIDAENKAKQSGGAVEMPSVRIPMFRGLMANPLSTKFDTDGPMIMIGAGVGMAPFRGFILNRLRNSKCANKIWLIQGVRDSTLDEIYSGELGDHEKEIKKVVQSRAKPPPVDQSDAGVVDIQPIKGGDVTGKVVSESQANKAAKYVQDEVRMQADIVWFVINALDGRIFVCGSSKGMGEGVEEALIDVAMDKGTLNFEEAKDFWAQKRDVGQYVAVSSSPCDDFHVQSLVHKLTLLLSFRKPGKRFLHLVGLTCHLDSVPNSIAPLLLLTLTIFSN